MADRAAAGDGWWHDYRRSLRRALGIPPVGVRIAPDACDVPLAAIHRAPGDRWSAPRSNDHIVDLTADLQRWLDHDEVRVAVLCGAAGSGKTTCVMQLAAGDRANVLLVSTAGAALTPALDRAWSALP